MALITLLQAELKGNFSAVTIDGVINFHNLASATVCDNAGSGNASISIRNLGLVNTSATFVYLFTSIFTTMIIDQA